MFRTAQFHQKKFNITENITENAEIIRLRMKDDLNIGAIAEILNKSKCVVYGILKVYTDYGLSEARKSTGRPRIPTKRDHAMVKLVKKDQFKTAAAVFREISIQLGKPLSRKTVSHCLVEQLLSRAPAVKPLISSKNKMFHLAFANEHVMVSRKMGNGAFQ